MRVVWTREPLADQPGVVLFVASLHLDHEDRRLHLGAIRVVDGTLLPPHRASFYEAVDLQLAELDVSTEIKREILQVLGTEVDRPSHSEVAAFRERADQGLRG